jgi:predicted ABC-type ATPase
MIERIDTLAQQKVDFAIESTLAGKTLVARLKALKEAAYRLHLVYLWLDSPELALARVAERVSQGGHHVPDETVHRRFFAGLRNLFALYLPLADYWVIYDNSGSEPVRIAYGDADGIRIENSDLYQWIERMGKS